MPNKAGGITEREWQGVLTDALSACGYMHSHCYPLRTQHGWRTPTSLVGYPDIVAWRGPYFVVIEAKTDAGRLDPNQRRVLTAMSAIAGARVWVLRPRDDLQAVVGWLRDPKEAPRVYGFDLDRSPNPG